MSDPVDVNGLITTTQAAILANVHQSTIRRMILDGELRAEKQSGQRGKYKFRYLIDPGEVIKAVQENPNVETKVVRSQDSLEEMIASLARTFPRVPTDRIVKAAHILTK